jgi:UDP-2,3-diacylglucosamine pyrophosphatase LpxH
MTDYKTIWISDIHLGADACKADKLCAFLKQNNCDNLYLVGDIIDGWKLERKWNWPQEHSNVIRRILTKAKRDTKIFYVIGNHDEFLRSWLSENVSIGEIHFSNHYDYTDLKGRKWLITHGDQFDQVVRHWKFISILGDMAYNFLLSCNNILYYIRSFFGFNYWSLSKYIKNKTKQAINFIYKFEENLANYAEKKKYHGIICGHIHTPAIKKIGNIIYMNDGDWVETCSAIVETIDGKFQLLLLDGDNMKVIETYE